MLRKKGLVASRSERRALKAGEARSSAPRKLRKSIGLVQ